MLAPLGLTTGPNSLEPRGGYDISFFVRILPYFEQGPVYNSIIWLVDSATHPANITLAGVGMSAFWCPSAPDAEISWDLSATTGQSVWQLQLRMVDRLRLPPGHWFQHTTNYRGCTGIFNNYYDNRGTLGITNQLVRLASITDGTSNTMLLAEVTSSWVNQTGHWAYFDARKSVSLEYVDNVNFFRADILDSPSIGLTLLLLVSELFSSNCFEYAPGRSQRLVHRRVGAFHQGLNQFLARRQKRLLAVTATTELHYNQSSRRIQNSQSDGRSRRLAKAVDDEQRRSRQLR